MPSFVKLHSSSIVLLFVALIFASAWMSQAGRVLRNNENEGMYHDILGFGKYKLGPEASWEAARRACARESAHLWIINSETEAKAVIRQLGIQDWTYIGFDDYTHEGEYVTPHGTTLKDAGYRKWRENEKYPGHRVGVVNGKGSMSGESLTNSSRRYVCEKHSVFEHAWEMRPPWLPLGYRTLRNYRSGEPMGAYKVHRDIVLWETARRRCERDSAHLLMPTSAAEAAAVFLTIENDEWYWVGFENWEDSEKYITFDGSVFDPEKLGCELKTHKKCKSTHRAGMVKRSGVFTTGSGMERRPFICELYPIGYKRVKTRLTSPPANYKQLIENGRSFYKISYTKEMWETARRLCETDGAHLAYITSQEEAKLVLAQVKGRGNILLGFDDFTLQGEFVYLDGTPVEDSGIHWAGNDTGNDRVGCITKNGKLTTCNPFVKYPYICEWEDQRVPATEMVYPHRYRPVGMIGWYRVYRACVPWMTASRICEADGAHLMVVNSPYEFQSVLESVEHKPCTFWLGFEDFEERGTFRTVMFNETLEDAGYANWDPTFPASNFSRDARCGIGNSEGLLGKQECDVILPFICELIIK